MNNFFHKHLNNSLSKKMQECEMYVNDVIKISEYEFNFEQLAEVAM